MTTDRLYSVSELGRDLGVTARTLRFYEDRGLLQPGRVGTTRVYAPRDRARMILILRGKRLGFSLRDIKDYLDLYDVDASQLEQVRVLQRAVDQRIIKLEQQRLALDETLAELREIRNQAEAAVRAKQPPRRAVA